MEHVFSGILYEGQWGACHPPGWLRLLRVGVGMERPRGGGGRDAHGACWDTERDRCENIYVYYQRPDLFVVFGVFVVMMEG